MSYIPTQGYGVQQSDSEAEKWWSLAGNHGDDPSSVRAQNTLGMFYSRQETFDPNKVRACVYTVAALCVCVWCVMCAGVSLDGASC